MSTAVRTPRFANVFKRMKGIGASWAAAVKHSEEIVRENAARGVDHFERPLPKHPSGGSENPLVMLPHQLPAKI